MPATRAVAERQRQAKAKERKKREQEAVSGFDLCGPKRVPFRFWHQRAASQRDRLAHRGLAHHGPCLCSVRHPYSQQLVRQSASEVLL
jgi:hypothetical protein